jgi:hypothetical protein
MMIRSFVLSVILICLSYGEAVAAGRTYVRGHIRSNGTYVAPHYRTSPDSSFRNNWSTVGNVNPYTGKVGTKTQPSYRYPTRVDRTYEGFSFAAIPISIPEATEPIETTPGDVRDPLASSSSAEPRFNNEIAKTRDPQESETIPFNISNGILDLASRQWPNDYAMQAHVIEAQRNGYIELLTSIRKHEAVGIPRDILDWALNRAQDRWFEDFAMQAHFYDGSLEGYLKLSALLSSAEFASLPANHSEWILSVVYARWEDDFAMQAFFLEQQLDGYYELSRLLDEMKQVPDSVANKIFSSARAKWPADLSMQAFVVEQELAGYKKVLEYAR